MRTSIGKPSGELLAQIEGWTLHKTEKGTYKLCSVIKVKGKANYFFEVADKRINTTAGWDSATLRTDYPRLFDAVNVYLEGEIEQAAKSEADTYGDIALSRGSQLTSEQEYQRQLLHMRRQELEYVAREQNGETLRPRSWEMGVRMLHTAVFKRKILDADLGKALAYVTRATGRISFEALIQVEQDYYSHKYRPRSCETLAASMEMLAGEAIKETFDDLI